MSHRRAPARGSRLGCTSDVMAAHRAGRPMRFAAPASLRPLTMQMGSGAIQSAPIPRRRRGPQLAEGAQLQVGVAVPAGGLARLGRPPLGGDRVGAVMGAQQRHPAGQRRQPSLLDHARGPGQPAPCDRGPAQARAVGEVDPTAPIAASGRSSRWRKAAYARSWCCTEAWVSPTHQSTSASPACASAVGSRASASSKAALAPAHCPAARAALPVASRSSGSAAATP